MVKLRRNHGSSKAIGGRLIVIVIGAAIAITWFWSQLEDMMPDSPPPVPLEELIAGEDPRWFLPESTTGAVFHRDEYSFSYAEEHEQSEWVAYVLAKEKLKVPNVPRTDWFEEDPLVVTGSAHYEDYRGSGYSRGHLAPAGDMAHSKEAMEESFFMSNISPQLRAFNGGIWNELEMTVRDWAFDFDSLYVITGPVLRGEDFEQIGRNGVSVPGSFYKIIAVPNREKERTIAFLIPNELSTTHLREYIVTVDSIEARTGIDFFPDLFDPEIEAAIESSLPAVEWHFNESRYRTRIEKWNHR